MTKLIVLRDKDRNFVAALLKANLVYAHLIAERLSTVPTRTRNGSRAGPDLADFDGLDSLPENDRLTTPRDVPAGRLSSPTAGSASGTAKARYRL